MLLWPFLKRQMVESSRRRPAFSDRLATVVVLTVVIAALVLVWDRYHWDRTSVAGAARFGLCAFGAVVLLLVGLTVTVATMEVAPMIASERDRKSLDALLTTRFSAAEIVLGAVVQGIWRSANVLVASLPVVVLVTVLGGIDVRLLPLAGVGIAATVFAAAALSVAASVVARTGTRARSTASGLLTGWFVLPLLFVVLLPRLWSGCPPWLITIGLWVLASSPMGVLARIAGLGGVGSLLEATLTTIALELIGGATVILWAIWRLRPASRALHDAEGQIAMLKTLRAARRRPPRAPCGDDPVLWNEMHARRPMSYAARYTSRIVFLLSMGVLAWATSWFAGPAFTELAQRGYGASPEAFTMPETNPFARLLINNFSPGLNLAPSLGNSRLEFNIALRQFSPTFLLLFVLSIFSAGSASVVAERKRERWLDLLATPLTAWEIVRAKMLGAIWSARFYMLMLTGLWTVGLLAGSLHPLGFLAGIGWLVIWGWFYAAMGVSAVLTAENQADAGTTAAWIVVPMAVAALFLLMAVPVVLGWISFFTYEDVFAALHSAPFPQFSRTPRFERVSARLILGGWLFAALAQTTGAFFLTRNLCRRFDKAVGRPTRPSCKAVRPDLGGAVKFSGPDDDSR